ncbi:MAG: restriction endonuclease subunit S [Ginsengibacter sp.]
MKSTLKEIASIQTGVFAKPIANGDIVYLQSKHFDEDGLLKHVLHPDLKPEKISQKHMLRTGDVLFASKGTKNFAVCFENDNQPAVASTSFFVIRVLENLGSSILPGFLAWFLNHPATQKMLKAKAIGTSIVSISKVVLEELKVSIPPVKTQKTILQIAYLRNKEKKMKQQIENLREQKIQHQIIKAIK